MELRPVINYSATMIEISLFGCIFGFFPPSDPGVCSYPLNHVEPCEKCFSQLVSLPFS